MPANPQPPEERDVSVIALRLASDPSLSREDLAAAIASALREERERNSNRAWRIRALEDQARADHYQEALREIAHAEGYDGSLCDDPEDCPNCVARAALDDRPEVKEGE